MKKSLWLYYSKSGKRSDSRRIAILPDPPDELVQLIDEIYNKPHYSKYIQTEIF